MATMMPSASIKPLTTHNNNNNNKIMQTAIERHNVSKCV